MKMMTIKMMTITSTMMTSMKTPMSMGMMIMMQTIMSTIIFNKLINSSWMSMVTFLMMIGGLMIIFSYMSSIASNTKFKMKMNVTLIMLIILIPHEELILQSQIEEKQTMLTSTVDKLSMMKLFNKKSMMLTIMMMTYLLITMIAVTKITKHYKGPLRKMTYE